MSESELLARMFVDESAELVDQSIAKVRHCLAQLTTEQIWRPPHAGGNSIGNLLRHMCGNLHQWISSGIGGAADQRDRESEFSSRDEMPPAELLKIIETTVKACRHVLNRLGARELVEGRTIQGFDVSVLQAISHTTTHFLGHTHQIILITRLILGEQYVFHWTPDGPRDRVPV